MFVPFLRLYLSCLTTLAHLPSLSCQTLLQVLSVDHEAHLLPHLLAEVAPEDFCARRGLCNRPQCRLWDAKTHFEPAVVQATLERLHASTRLSKLMHDARMMLEESAKAIATAERAKRGWDFLDVGQHLPAWDDDNDTFSPKDTLRGASWRGKDCQDLAASVYPGRRVTDYPPEVDHNCNGIAGRDETGNSLEEVLCGKSEPRGVIVLGDSISAHFHIPVPSRANLTLDDLFLMALNEIDYPQCSWGTGFAQDFKLCSEVSQLALTSVYQKLAERNRCNHRDYQNISRNGARSSSTYRDLVPTIGRHSDTDHPSIVFYSMLANDVCNGRNGTGSMTPPADFHLHVTNTLVHLNTVLAPGSTVVLVGLIHGELMWESIHDEPHFIGATYGALWDFLACLEETACWGWLNADPYWRQATSDHAESLRVVLRDIAASQRYANLNVVYMEHPDREYHRDYAYVPLSLSLSLKDDRGITSSFFFCFFSSNAGGSLFDLYEVMDGGHPSVTGEILMGDYIWRLMERDFPDALGPVNPNNARIQALFGDQGGY